MLEKEIEKKLRDAVKASGGIAYKWSSPNNAGVPDRLVFLPGGRLVIVELKQEGKSSTKLQKLHQERLRNLGFDVREVVGPKGLEEFLKEFGL